MMILRLAVCVLLCGTLVVCQDDAARIRIARQTGGSIPGISVPGLPDSSSLLQIILRLPGVNSSEECSTDASTVLAAMLEAKPWALRMFDATGKAGSGILEGSIRFTGNYDECRDLRGDAASGQQVTGDMCVITIAPPVPVGAVIGGTQAVFSEKLPGIQEFANNLSYTETLIVSVVPRDVSGLVKCRKSTWRGVLLTVYLRVLVSLLFFMILLGSAVDLYLRVSSWRRTANARAAVPPLHENKGSTHLDMENDPTKDVTSPTTNGVQPVDGKTSFTQIAPLWHRVLLCFSAVTNGEKILSVKSTPGSLTCLNGIRVLSMGWVILGHTFVQLNGVIENPTFVSNILKTFSFQIVANASLSVDSFFVLSGLLVSYLFLKQTDKTGGIKPRIMIMYYVHRYIRLTPTYAFVILLYTCLVRYMTDGPQWTGPIDRQYCERNWWTNILYVNNFVREDAQCFNWGWYMALDFQLYMIAPLVLIPLALASRSRHERILRSAGVIMAVVFVIVSLVTTLVLNSRYDGNLFHNSSDYFKHVYIKPYCRVGTFAVGLLLGYVLYKNKLSLKIPAYLQFVGWLLALVVALACTFTTFDEKADGRPEWGVEARVAHDALSRIGWSVVVAWVILMCLTGKGGLINWILSWNWWMPLSRITYGVFLLHPIIIHVEAATTRVMLYFTVEYVVFRFLGYVTASYALSFVLALMAEAPSLQLEKLAFG